MKRNIPNAAILILLAVSLILWKLDIFPVFGILGGISTFGVIIAVLMIVILYWGLTNMFFGAIFFPIAILCIIFDKPLGIEALTPWTVMIVATLLTVAAYIIFPAGNRMAMINERKYNSDAKLMISDVRALLDLSRKASKNFNTINAIFEKQCKVVVIPFTPSNEKEIMKLLKEAEDLKKSLTEIKD